MTKQIRPLVIGIGTSGRRHLDAQLNLGNKTGIYTTNPQTAKSLRKQKNIIIFENLEDGMGWANLVHVCTPDDKHTESVAKALKKGKTVLCEKPFTTILKEALFLQNLASKYGINVFVGQNYRLTPTFVEIRKKVLEGQLGIISHIKTTYFHDREDFQRRYKGKYFLYTGGSHAVDLACWIANKQIVSVRAYSENNLKFHITIQFTSGLKGDVELDASLPRPISGTDLIVDGERGKLTSHNKLDKLFFSKYEDKKNQSILLPNSKTFTIPLEIKIVNDYLLGKTVSHWPLPDVKEAVDLIKILEAAKKSIASDRNEKV